MTTRIYVPSDKNAHRRLLNESNLSWEKIAKYYSPSADIGDWRNLVEQGKWKTGYSAEKLATAWENAKPGLPPKIAALFDSSAELLAAMPEYKTDLPGSNRHRVNPMCLPLFAQKSGYIPLRLMEKRMNALEIPSVSGRKAPPTGK